MSIDSPQRFNVQCSMFDGKIEILNPKSKIQNQKSFNLPCRTKSQIKNSFPDKQEKENFYYCHSKQVIPKSKIQNQKSFNPPRRTNSEIPNPKSNYCLAITAFNADSSSLIRSPLTSTTAVKIVPVNSYGGS